MLIIVQAGQLGHEGVEHGEIEARVLVHVFRIHREGNVAWLIGDNYNCTGRSTVVQCQHPCVVAKDV
jgi:hypothetical protein